MIPGKLFGAAQVLAMESRKTLPDYVGSVRSIDPVPVSSVTALAGATRPNNAIADAVKVPMVRITPPGCFARATSFLKPTSR